MLTRLYFTVITMNIIHKVGSVVKRITIIERQLRLSRGYLSDAGRQI